MSKEINDVEYEVDEKVVEELTEEFTPDEDLVCPILWDKVKTVADLKVILNAIFTGIKKSNPAYQDCKEYGYIGQPTAENYYRPVESKNLNRKKRRMKK